MEGVGDGNDREVILCEKKLNQLTEKSRVEVRRIESRILQLDIRKRDCLVSNEGVSN